MKIQLELIIERTGARLWGRVIFNNNLITDTAENITELELQLKNLLEDQHQLGQDQISFYHTFDLQSFFDRYSFLKISDIAKLSGMNAALLRQYASGVKNPSAKQVKKIEDTVHRLGQQMQQLKLIAV